MREAVGPGVVLRLDANQGWDAHEAVRILRDIRDVGVELVEQPVPRRDVLGLAHVRAHARELGIPVLADESVFGQHQLRDAALAAALLLTEQTPTDYGFTDLRRGNDAMRFQYSRWLLAPGKRKAAFEKWTEWRKKNP